MYYYSTLGISIQSEFVFPELKEIKQPNAIDVTITEGRIPIRPEDLQMICEGLWISGHEYLATIVGVADYYVSEGKKIIVSAHPQASRKNVRMYLLSNALAAIMHQRGFIPLHASGFNTENGVVLIIGASGAGKSTTIKALTAHGFDIFTDDVCVVKEIDEKPYGIPSYPVLKLWESSFELLDIGDVSKHTRIWPEADKFGIDFHTSFETKWKPIWQIFILETTTIESKTIIKKESLLEAFKKIGANTYRNEYVEPMKLNALHFRTVSNLVNQCKIFTIVRPINKNSIADVVNSIMKKLRN